MNRNDIQEKKIYKRFLKVKGYDNQIFKTIEELSELIRALVKYELEKTNANYEKLLKEIVDAELMIGQTKYNLNQGGYIKILKQQKLKDLNELLETLEQKTKTSPKEDQNK